MKRILPILAVLVLAGACDMRPYTDSEGHSYDFAYGMDWSGVIDDARVRAYRKWTSIKPSSAAPRICS